MLDSAAAAQDPAAPRDSTSLLCVWAAVRSILCGLCAVAVCGCGGSSPPPAQIRATVAQLQKAVADRDAKVLCDLLFPFGQHRSAGELAAEIERINGGQGDPSWREEIALCVRDMPRHPDDFVAYQRTLGGGSLHGIAVHGDTATGTWIVGNQRPQPLRFVHLAGKWRLLIGVQ